MYLIQYQIDKNGAASDRKLSLVYHFDCPTFIKLKNLITICLLKYS